MYMMHFVMFRTRRYLHWVSYPRQPVYPPWRRLILAQCDWHTNPAPRQYPVLKSHNLLNQQPRDNSTRKYVYFYNRTENNTFITNINVNKIQSEYCEYSFAQIHQYTFISKQLHKIQALYVRWVYTGVLFRFTFRYTCRFTLSILIDRTRHG